MIVWDSPEKGKVGGKGEGSLVGGKLPPEVNMVMFRSVEHSRPSDHRCLWKNKELMSSLDVHFSYGSV